MLRATVQSPFDACDGGTAPRFLLCDSSPLQFRSICLVADVGIITCCLWGFTLHVRSGISSDETHQRNRTPLLPLRRHGSLQSSFFTRYIDPALRKKPRSRKVDTCGTVFDEIALSTLPIIYHLRGKTAPITRSISPV